MSPLRPRPEGELFDAARAAEGARPAPPERPWVALNMACSADGSVSRAGLSAGLSGEADRALFRALRARADVILVGAGTMRAEQYGPARPEPEAAAERIARGQSSAAPIAVVSEGLSFDLDSPFFTEAEQRPLVLTHGGSDRARREQLAALADVVLCGESAVDPTRALAALGERGQRFVLLEGGPRLNAALFAADVIDEVNLTVAPLVTGGDAGRVVQSATELAVELRLERVLEHDGFLFLRYLRRG